MCTQQSDVRKDYTAIFRLSSGVPPLSDKGNLDRHCVTVEQLRSAPLVINDLACQVMVKLFSMNNGNTGYREYVIHYKKSTQVFISKKFFLSYICVSTEVYIPSFPERIQREMTPIEC